METLERESLRYQETNSIKLAKENNVPEIKIIEDERFYKIQNYVSMGYFNDMHKIFNQKLEEASIALDKKLKKDLDSFFTKIFCLGINNAGTLLHDMYQSTSETDFQFLKELIIPVFEMYSDPVNDTELTKTTREKLAQIIFPQYAVYLGNKIAAIGIQSM